MEWLDTIVATIGLATDFIIHIDVHLRELIENYGNWIYLILFVIVFCETGLIVTPYLPGDSLLFAAGAFAGLGMMDITTLTITLFAAAVLGDMTNYWTARVISEKGIESNKLPLVKMEHIEKAHEFLTRHGAKSIVLARFVPIVRTFAPFVAGFGKMDYRRFTIFNVFGAALWIGLFLPAGYFFGNNVTIQKNFTLVVLGVIFVSILPILFEFARHNLRRRLATK